MLFADVVGQIDVKENLVQMVAQNRVSHALLFVGKEGSGTLPLALAFAQYMVCEKISGRSSTGGGLFDATVPVAEITQPADACGVCPACRKAAALVHADIHFSYPVIPKKPGDKPVSTDYATEWREFVAQSPYGNVYDWLQFIGAENRQGNITAAECADILRKLSLKSFESGYKILVMWMPEYIEKEGNKLLKLIEEPPPDTLFILVAENESMVLPTIVSRCQVTRIPPLSIGDIEQALRTRSDVTPAQARQYASVSEGNLREALQLVQHTGDDWTVLLKDWLNAILKSGPIAQTKWVEEVARLGRERQKQFLRYFTHMLEQSIRVRVSGEDIQLRERWLNLSAEELDFALRLNKTAGVAQQQAIVQALDNASYHIERNANAKMLFHALTIKLYHIIADKSLILTN